MARPMALSISKKLFNHFSSPVITKFRLNSTFEAACLKEYGKPLVIDKFTRVLLKPGEVRVDVKYCSLNINDVKYLEKTNENDKLLPFIPGYELSGEVLEVGEGCDLSVGQRVVGIIQSGHGGLATEAVLGCNSIWVLPSEIPCRDAAAIVCGHSTAMLAFTQYAPLNEGDIVLVLAGAGGYGLAGVEVAASIFKAKVIAVADTDGKASLLRDRGAFAAYKNDLKHNFKEIMKATKDKGVNLIYDSIGGQILNTVVKCINDPDKGLIVGTYRLKKENAETQENISEKTESNESYSGEKDKASEKPKEKEEEKNESEEKKTVILSQEVQDRFRNVNIFRYREQNQEDFYSLVSQVLEYYEEEVISAHISQTFQLSQVNEAIHYIKGKMCTGKVIIKIKDN